MFFVFLNGITNPYPINDIRRILFDRIWFTCWCFSFTYKWFHFSARIGFLITSWVCRCGVGWDWYTHAHTHTHALFGARHTGTTSWSLIGLVEPPRISTRTVNELCWLSAGGSNIYATTTATVTATVTATWRRLRRQRRRKDQATPGQSNSNNNSNYNESTSRTMCHKSNRITSLIAAWSGF